VPHNDKSANGTDSGKLSRIVNGWMRLAQAVWQTETREADGAGILPPGFTFGENAGSFAAHHFFITSDAGSGRGVRARLEQGFYVVVPAS
jgi:hypothetical protein